MRAGRRGARPRPHQVRWGKEYLGQIGVGQPDPGAGLEGRLGVGLGGLQSL